ncbi:hypothetical protein BKA63DRAFT_584465 [Paraphoma chrysanthemicola]|nr:hypothetical protein BKA63DRAFT_584465 [Paraphoma chrysanthemicola]
MALSMLEAIRQSQSQEKREEHRARRCNLIATCTNRPVVLKDGKLWIDTGAKDGAPLGHAYAGYYLPYPDSNHEGLVTTITDVAPVMNWVYIDRETHEAKYGVRVDAQPNFTGPFDCTRQDRRLTFAGWEGWCAVEEQPGSWALYFDVDDDGLKSKVTPNTRVLEIELSRKEKRFQKEAAARQQDQTTKRAVDVKQDAPIDEALAPEALVSKPGVADAESGGKVEEVKPTPFMMPKSIFENPPPMLKESMFERPSTPPPAYETKERPLPFNIPPVLDDKTDPTRILVSPMQSGFKLSVNTPTRRSLSPTAIRQEAPAIEKRVTPVKRSSGTRTLAKAQIFEALAAGQKPDAGAKAGGSRESRASSNADSVSVYSVDGPELSKNTEIAPQISPTPAPLALRAAETKVPPKSVENVTPSKSDQEGLPRQTAFPDAMDPAVFGTGAPQTRRTFSTRRPSATTSAPGRKQPTPRNSSQASATLKESLARKPSTSRSISQDSPRPRIQRRGTTSNPRPTISTSTTSTRTQSQASRSTASTSLAATMTTGRGNQGMATRVGGAVAPPRGRPGRSNTVQGSPSTGAARKTTSALFREIDELVSQDIGGGAASTGK